MRIKFVKQTDRYAKGACIHLPDDQAAIAIKRGDAEEIEGPMTVGDPVRQDTAQKRIEFVKGFTVGSKRYHIGERMTLSAKEADVFLKANQAKEFPVTVVGDEKELQPPADKMIRRGQLVTK